MEAIATRSKKLLVAKCLHAAGATGQNKERDMQSPRCRRGQGMFKSCRATKIHRSYKPKEPTQTTAKQKNTLKSTIRTKTLRKGVCKWPSHHASSSESISSPSTFHYISLMFCSGAEPPGAWWQGKGEGSSHCHALGLQPSNHSSVHEVMVVLFLGPFLRPVIPSFVHGNYIWCT